MTDTAHSAEATAALELRMVIPIRNEGERFERFLGDLANGPESPVTEFVVVDDGSAPAMTAVHARAVEVFGTRMLETGRPHRARLIVSPVNRGKAAAVRRGWAEGDLPRWLGFVDGDGAVPARELWRLAAWLLGSPRFDALLGSRVQAPGTTVHRQALRALQGAAFARFANALLGIGVADPQCGLKYFRTERLAPLLPKLQERGWSLDPEILLYLRNAGCSFREEPIDWTEHGSSKVVFGVDAVKMAWQLLGIRRRIGVVRGGLR